MALTRAQIQTAFQNSLGRAASQSDENSYFSVSQSGALSDAQIFATISNSREADQIADPVIRFYQAAFGRVPDQAGLANAEAYVRAFSPTAATYQNLSNMFAQSTEFTNRFGTGTAVDAAYVQALYSTILNRSATNAEVDGYVSGAAGYTTRGGVLYAISQSSEAINLSDTAVNGFQLNAAQGQAVYTGSVYTQQNGSTGGTVGVTTPLTVNVDNFTGGAGNDLYTAINANINDGDTINGGAGTDTLRISGSTAIASVTPILTSVERVEVQNFSAAATQVINLGSSTGVTTVASNNGLNAGSGVTFTGLKSFVGAEVNSGTTGTLTLTYDANVVSGTADTQALTLNAGNLTTLSAVGIETLAITSSGTSAAANTTNTLGAIVDTSLKAITVGGTGTVVLGGTTALVNGGADGTTTFNLNASANSGGVTATFGAGATTATGGSGNDKFAFGANFDTTDTVVGGAGTDTIAINGINFTTAGANANQFALLNTKVSGVEVLELTGAAATTIDRAVLTNSEITKILFNTTDANNADTITNLTSATTVSVGTLNFGALNLGAAQGQQTANLSVEGSATAAAGAGTVTLTNATTLNIASSGTFTDDNALTGVTTVSNSVLNITGSKSINLGTLATAANNTAGNIGDTVSASSFTGKLTLIGTGANDVITVGSGGSVITGGTGSDTITLGSSTDRVVYSTSGDSTAATPASTLDTVNGFAAGTDKFIVGTLGAAALPTALVQGATYTAAGTGTLATDIGSALQAGGQGAAGITLAVGTAAVVSITGTGAGTYLVYNDTTAGYQNSDTVVKLAGLTGTLALTDFATA